MATKTTTNTSDSGFSEDELAAMKQRPAVQNLLVVTNANDPAVNNSLTRQLVSLWQARGLQQVSFYEFDRREALEHDLVDPNNPKQRVDLVYPILLDLLTRDDVPGVSIDRPSAPLELVDQSGPRSVTATSRAPGTGQS